MNRDEHFIRTFTGKKYFFMNPTEEQIDIEDIINGLSIECRFNNCCPVFYSVLQHSINVCLMSPYQYRLEGLLHDWTEAYMKDVPKPLKILIPDYQRIEKIHEEVGARKFKLQYPYPSIIKEIDSRMALTEAQQLIKDDSLFYLYKGLEPFALDVTPINSDILKKEFKALYEIYKRS